MENLSTQSRGSCKEDRSKGYNDLEAEYPEQGG